jgi:isopenicillin N synthase-like dioxygenase
MVDQTVRPLREESPVAIDLEDAGPPFVVPVVDIAPYVAGGTAAERDRVARAVDDACSEVGFIQVLGHGIADRVIESMTGAMDSFFGLPLAAKNRYRVPGNRGYNPPASESLSHSIGVESYGGDYFEGFNIGRPASTWPELDLPVEDYAENTWPTELEGFEAPTTAYFDEAGRVARTMVRIFADALGLASGFFDTFTDHSIDVLRMNHYALPEGTEVLDESAVGMGAHTDFGIVTVLWADQAPGLQVLGHDGIWHDIRPAPGALLINLGDLTARWTNERWLSTMHRVVPPVVDGRVTRRRSVAFFHDGNVEAVVETLPSCVPDGTAALYRPITIGENLAAKLAGSRAGVVNAAAQREAERVRSASGV